MPSSRAAYYQLCSAAFPPSFNHCATTTPPLSPPQPWQPPCGGTTQKYPFLSSKVVMS